MPDTLYVTDLDGTLLGPDARVSDESARILRRLSEQGVMVTAATARTPASVQPLLAKCGLRVPAVVMTGAATWDFDRQEYHDIRYINPEVVRGIDLAFRDEPLHPFVYTLDDPSRPMRVYHRGKGLNRIEQKFVNDRSNLPLKRFCLGCEVPAGKEACRVMYFAMGDPVVVGRVAKRLHDLPGCYISHYVDTYNENTALLEVFADGVDKARAVLALKKATGADRLVVFGDNLNDLSMFAVADTAVAVANALPEVRDKADTVIGPNTADSVPRFIAAERGIIL